MNGIPDKNVLRTLQEIRILQAIRILILCELIHVKHFTRD